MAQVELQAPPTTTTPTPMFKSLKAPLLGTATSHLDQGWQLQTVDGLQSRSVSWNSLCLLPGHSGSSEAAIPEDPLQIFMCLDDDSASEELGALQDVNQDVGLAGTPLPTTPPQPCSKRSMGSYDTAETMAASPTQQNIKLEPNEETPSLLVESLFSNCRGAPRCVAGTGLLGRPPMLTTMTAQPVLPNTSGLLQLPVCTPPLSVPTCPSRAALDSLFDCCTEAADLVAWGKQSAPGRVLLPSDFLMASSQALSSDERSSTAAPCSQLCAASDCKVASGSPLCPYML